MNKWTELLVGMILLVGAVLVGWASWAYSWTIAGRFDLNFLHAAWIVLKGGIWWFVVMLGLLFILLGISDLKE